METQHSLTRWGVNLTEAHRLNCLTPKERYDFLKDQFATYELHVVRNSPVSRPYQYWFSKDERIYTNESQTQELEIDPKERDGLYEIGIKKSFRLAHAHPNQLVFLFSPPGPASFKDPPDPEYAKPYNIGQLYIMYYDGSKINNVGVSINENEDNWLKQIYDTDFLRSVDDNQDILDCIRQFITCPQLTSWTIDDFLDHRWQDPEMLIFSSNNFGKIEKHYLNGVMHQIRESLLGKIQISASADMLAKKLAYDGGRYIPEEKLLESYQEIIAVNMKDHGVQEMTLGGGCGGGSVKSGDLGNIDIIQEIMASLSPNLSSDHRKSLQTQNPLNKSEDYKNDPNLCRCSAASGPHFHCPGKNETCKHPIVVGEGTTKCPSCGTGATCSASTHN